MLFPSTRRFSLLRLDRPALRPYEGEVALAAHPYAGHRLRLQIYR